MSGVRAGQWWCNTHGAVTPHRGGVVPACPACGIAVLQAVNDGAKLVYREPAPERCAGIEKHPLRPGRVLLGWTACLCNPNGGHRSWQCAECDDVQIWPPHSIVDDKPYFGPGHNDAWRSTG
ncbi:hypothetical protein [Catenuloplanes indicus]|uniref:RNA-binding Zn-ribbon protein involved in translation (DUF1610 family) n=1 Tax=Catenuloplanes indicus TaxID=137267 RepID=A0AAE3W7V4_9ACTN|nr:hypothetical protein [Catenuloplanes indicus]MDQ0371638.1 putative RNA-binding Zn-ribbon protein involved in translation (DUF1610 family) [Catenuloplanes indicus]